MSHDGPFFDDLRLGDVFAGAPSVTLTDGLAAAHHAIVGGRYRLALDAGLSRRVAGSAGALASPAFAWDVSIGQSTLVTQRAIANLFYRGLFFLRAPEIGDTLLTRTEIVGLRPAAAKADRPARGLAVMRVTTSDGEGRPVLDFFRCALLPARLAAREAASGLLEPQTPAASPASLAEAASGWDLAAFRSALPSGHFAALRDGQTREVAGDVVTSAPELARLTLNLAAIHHDSRAGGGTRLVYGGHTIGLAAAQASRAFPDMVTILGWHGCDHLGPVRENDTVRSTIAVERLEPLPSGGGIAHLRSRVVAEPVSGGSATDVLDWRFVALFA